MRSSTPRAVSASVASSSRSTTRPMCAAPTTKPSWRNALPPARCILVGRPETRRVRRERLVPEHEATTLVHPELELRVRDDDAARTRIFRCVAVQIERHAFDLVEACRVDQLERPFTVDVLVVTRHRLRRRREDRFRQLRGLDEPGW